MFSNYGDLPNEMLIYAYGFAFEENDHDSVAVTMGVKQSCSAGAVEKTFYLTSGPDFSGVPKVIFVVFCFITRLRY
jgi:hypothetical protein